MTGFGNPDTQREQAVYQIMGIPLGRGGVDGIRGPATNSARELFAERMGIDPKNEVKIKEAIDGKLKDTFTRENFLRNLSIISPDKLNMNDVKASQWLLKEQGMDMSKSINPLNGMMDGRLGPDTRNAIQESKRAAPSQDDIAKYGGPNARFINDLVATKGWGYNQEKDLNSPNVQAFDRAAAGATPLVEATPAVAPKIEQKVALGLPENGR
jgi:peptidoglycan hydrolase-like protein with peptidoglycan-binding domain